MNEALQHLQTPDRLTQQPPPDQFCDVVLNGGVASGVVYPWALLELARCYRFKNIGGNSVGAMAAAMAAAAEYGRCVGTEDAFEPLRQMPLELAKDHGGKTKMLSLFQPSKCVERLFALFLAAVTEKVVQDHAKPPAEAENTAGTTKRLLQQALLLYGFWPIFRVALAAALVLPLLKVLTGLATVKAWVDAGAVVYFASLGLFGLGAAATALCLVLAVALAVVLGLAVVAWRFYRDLKALAANNYGLCKGPGQTPQSEGLVEWLHQGIQRSAGRSREDPPLTFADLWAAPRFGSPGPAPRSRGLQPPDAAIDLQMFSSNVTLGRPLRLPLTDDGTRLFFDPEEWKEYFPPSVLQPLVQASAPYQPSYFREPRPSDPVATRKPLLCGQLYELPSGDMPIVVAARLSLCFPLLFSCVPVYAVDYESEKTTSQIRRCLLSDGGLCTNFPVHLFDAAHPRWPTFAVLLDQRRKNFNNQAVWLPKKHTDGGGDNWMRGVPGAEDDPTQDRSLFTGILGLVGGILLTMKDWNDRVTGRLPHVRNRTIRLALKPGEGQLNIGMPGATILKMAHEYGTVAGRQLADTFAPDNGVPKRAWSEHLYVRSMIELRALRRHLRGYTAAVTSKGSTLPLSAVLQEMQDRPLSGVNIDDKDKFVQQQAIKRASQALQDLESVLAATEPQLDRYRPRPEPELRLRPPV